MRGLAPAPCCLTAFAIEGSIRRRCWVAPPFTFVNWAYSHRATANSLPIGDAKKGANLFKVRGAPRKSDRPTGKPV